jgi:glycerate dehydrogenase
MKIVVLDGYPSNPGDLSWSAFQSLGQLQVFDYTADDDIVGHSAGADAVLTNKAPLSGEAIAALPQLRYVGVLATGFNIVDIAAARQRKIVVTNVPAYSTASVAQTTFALLLELTHHAGHHSETVHAGRWSANRDFCYWDFPLIELAGLTMGLIGLGAIGSAVAAIAHAFGMKVIAHSRSGKPMTAVEMVSLEDVFRRSDVLSLHCPQTPETIRLVNADRIALMKPSAFLLNPSRGGLVDERALADALNSGRLAGAGLDVLSAEPPPADNPLLSARNCIITPHIAWATKTARQRLLTIAADNLRNFIAGKPTNVVS